MTPVVLAAGGWLASSALLAGAHPESWLLTAVPQLGAIALLLWFGRQMLQEANKRTEDERALRIAEVDRERTERREAEARERVLAAAALPALQEANRALDQASQMIERQSKR